jgi:hypothetical protein
VLSPARTPPLEKRVSGREGGMLFELALVSFFSDFKVPVLDRSAHRWVAVKIANDSSDRNDSSQEQ